MTALAATLAICRTGICANAAAVTGILVTSRLSTVSR